MNENQTTPLRYLFFTFLKIGAISWGGFMALISVVQKQLVERDKKVDDEVILDGISLASVLPGPVAFNVVAYLGYFFRGFPGALVSMVAIILPSFCLVLILSYIYFAYSELPVFSHFFLGILPAVAAIIISVALNMTRKNIKDYRQMVILILSGLCLILLRSFFTTLIIIVLGGLAGWLLYRNRSSIDTRPARIKPKVKPGTTVKIIIGIVIVVLPAWFIPPILSGTLQEKAMLIRELMLTFSGMSLTLFGGGYVIIPAMQEVVVSGFQWLTTREFADAIAMGQITPGPIFISATFIGYKLGGFLGAVGATLAVFFPPAFLMILCSRFLDRIKQSSAVASVFKGLRPAVIGMIFAAAFTIGRSVELRWPVLLIFLGVLVLATKFKVNVVFLIPGSGIAGLLLFWLL